MVESLKFPTGEWEVSTQEKNLGSFAVEHGHVTRVEVQVYTRQDDSGSIDLGEALYWILYDNGKILPSTNRDYKETATDVHFTTRESEQRTLGSSQRIIFANMANGATYRIDMYRLRNGKPSVAIFVMKLAPFVKKK